MEEVGFDVTEEIVVGDLSEVKEQKFIVPATANVKVRIQKASVAVNKDKDVKFLKLELRIAEGILNEEGIPQYVNKPMFTNTGNPAEGLVIWADTTVKGRDQKDWWKNRQYQIECVKFLKALDFPIKPAPNVTDEFLQSLLGREVLVDIQHEEETAKNESGEYVGLGTYKERLRNFKKAE